MLGLFTVVQFLFICDFSSAMMIEFITSSSLKQEQVVMLMFHAARGFSATDWKPFS